MIGSQSPRRAGWIGGVFALAGALTLGCTGGGPSGPIDRGPPRVTVAKPAVENVVEWDRYIGRLDAIFSVEVKARVEGYLQESLFTEGSLVKRGDLLFVIDPRPYEAELATAEASLFEAEAGVEEARANLSAAEARLEEAEAGEKLAAVQLARTERLAERRAASQDDLDVARTEELKAQASVASAKAGVKAAEAEIATRKATVETAQAALRTAQLNLSYTRIYAPFDGRVSNQFIDQGNLIQVGGGDDSLLTRILLATPIHCYFDADERAFLKYARLAAAGERAEREDKVPVLLALADETGYPHRGHLDFVDNRIDPNTGTIRGRAIFESDGTILAPGLFARVRIPGSAPYDAVLIPDESVAIDQTNRYVWVVDEENVATRQTIELGPLVNGLRVVREGLDGSETIIVTGLQQVLPGKPVTPEETTIEPIDDGLPDEYELVPPEEWIAKPEREAFLGNGADSDYIPSLEEPAAKPARPQAATEEGPATATDQPASSAQKPREPPEAPSAPEGSGDEATESKDPSTELEAPSEPAEPDGTAEPAEAVGVDAPATEDAESGGP